MWPWTLTALAEFASVKEGKDTKKLSLEALGNDNALQWFCTKDAQNYVKGHADNNLATVFGFGRALASGYAFLSRVYVGPSLDTRYVGYEHALRCDPGTVLLDATADLGGMTQLCPWRVPRDIPQARYDRMTVVAEKPYPVRRLDLLFKKAQGRREYTEWMKEMIKRHTEPGHRSRSKARIRHQITEVGFGSAAGPASRVDPRRPALALR